MKISENNLRSLIREVLLSEKISMDVLRNVNPYAYLMRGAKAGSRALSKLASIDFGPSSAVDTDHSNRAVELSKATGVKPSVIYAIEKKESAHRPSAFAFNPRLFRKYADDPSFYPGVKSVYGDEAKRSFNEAYAIDPSAAIMAGAWGLYQVLGATSLELHGNNPERFLAAFKADPVGHSKDAFIKCGFEMAFIFKYSERSGTPAAVLDDKVPQEVKESRNKELLNLLEDQSLDSNQKLLGKTLEVLVEGHARKGEGKLFGRTLCYRKVVFPADQMLIGQTKNIEIMDVTANTLFGNLN